MSQWSHLRWSTFGLLLWAAVGSGGCIADFYDPPLPGLCGDSEIAGVEGCDDGNVQDGDGCSSVCVVESGWHCQGALSDCTTTCGDGISVGEEACDGSDLAGSTCVSLGHQTGALGCGANCTFDEAGCATLFTIQTTSATSVWRSQVVTNNGAPLIWEYGGVEYAEDRPIIDLSDNTDIATILIKSSDFFTGLTHLSLNDLEIVSTDHSQATSLLDYSVKENPGLVDFDTSTMPQVWRLTIRDNALTTLDLSNTPLLLMLFIYGNQLPSSELDQVLFDLDGHGVMNGELVMFNNAGEITSAAAQAYQSLIEKGWDIDVGPPPPP